MTEEAKMSPTIELLAVSLAKAQGQLQAASKSATNPFFKSKYADLSAVWEACRQPFSENGLSIVQMPTEAGEGRVALRTWLMHSSGQWICDTVSAKLVKDDPQGVGSAITYLRRYALSAAAGIVTDEDDDGNAASHAGQRQKPTPTREQYEATRPAPSKPAPPVAAPAASRTVEPIGRWEDVKIHFGTKHNGKTLGQISKEALEYYIKNVKITADADGVVDPAMYRLRKALDMAAKGETAPAGPAPVPAPVQMEMSADRSPKTFEVAATPVVETAQAAPAEPLSRTDVIFRLETFKKANNIGSKQLQAKMQELHGTQDGTTLSAEQLLAILKSLEADIKSA